ncbi:MAG TPA: hypothetical protein VFB27_07310 [Opitutaceae bacterium]|nr:hypothetical protein [Opitutaceae bacterium]
MNAKKINDFLKKQPVALCCAFLSLVLAGVIYYRSGAVPAAASQLADKTAEWEHIRDNVKNSEQLNEQSAALTQAMQAIEARLIHADQLASNLQYFYRLETETQTKLTDLRQIGVSKSKTGAARIYVSVGYAVATQGTYLRVMDFLRRIENSEHFCHVTSLTLSHTGGNEATGPAAELSLRLDLELLGAP